MNSAFELLFWLLFGGFALYFIFNVVRRGGFRGAMFNATVIDTVGEVEGSGQSMVKTKVKVHTLERNGVNLVGLEFVSTTIASYEMTGLTLTQAEARRLIAALNQAVAKA